VDTPLLATKLFVPEIRPGTVARPRLMRRLDSALTNSLTLVSAPAGFGKTTVLSQWIVEDGAPKPVAWVQLDEGDNDPVRFWDYVIGGLRKLRPLSGQIASSMLHAPQPYPIESVLTVLINEISEAPDDFVLVLDDYHLIKAEPIHSGVTFLLDHLPPKAHLAIATRVDPPVPLPRFRGKGTMLEIIADDLRFNEEESALLIKELSGALLGSEVVNTLNAKSEGWVVGLKMAAMAMRGRRDVRAFLASFTGSQRYIMDYLMEEVLKDLSPETEEFLLRTSVLARMTGSLCDALTGRHNGRDELARLEQSNLFLVPLDDSRQWYRYHHLFAELLRHQAEISFSPEAMATLHGQASQWYEGHGMLDDAIYHAISSRDWEQSLRLLHPAAEKRIYRREIRTVLNWLQALPDEVLRSHSGLYSQYCSALVFVGESEAAVTAVTHLETIAQQDRSLDGVVASLHSAMAARAGDIPRLVEQAGKALSLLPATSYDPRCRAGNELAMIRYAEGNLDEAVRLWLDAYEAARGSGNSWSGANALGWAARDLWMKGDLGLSADMSRKAVAMARQSPAAASPL
jgi:LuxR family transcriptional regulator, maltose regulon positive regulatory protein